MTAGVLQAKAEAIGARATRVAARARLLQAGSLALSAVTLAVCVVLLLSHQETGYALCCVLAGGRLISDAVAYRLGAEGAGPRHQVFPSP